MRRSNSRVKRIRACGFIIVLAASILTAGCKSMINPHFDLGIRPSTVNDGTTAHKSITIDEAVTYANEVKDKYRDALGNETTFSNVLGIGLIGVATAVPIMTLTAASTKSIGITAMSGAGAFGLGTWLQSTPRQKAYIQGYNAVNCAIEATSPLRNAKHGNSYKTFDAALKIVDTKIENVEKRIGDAMRWRNKNPEDVDNAIKIARMAIKEAEEARILSVELELELDTIGDNFVTAVDEIIGQIDLMILENKQDLAALSSIIGRLGGIYSQLSAVPPGLIGGGEIGAKPETETGMKKEAAAADEKQALSKLQYAVVELVSSTRQMADFVNAVINKKPIAALKKCRVDPSLIATALTIKPSSGVFTGKTEETKAFVIQGGAHPYRVTLLTGQGANVMASQPDLFGPAFVVQIKADTPLGTYSVYAADAAGRNAILEVKVGTQTTLPPSNKNGVKQGTNPPGGELFIAEKIDDRKKVQKALCVKPDGFWGNETQTALKKREATEKMTKDLFKKLFNMSDAEISKQCPGTSVAISIESVAKIIKGKLVIIKKEDKDYGVSIKEAGVNATESKLLVNLGIQETPEPPFSTQELREAVFKEAQKLKPFPSDVTVEMIEIENAQALKDANKLIP